MLKLQRPWRVIHKDPANVETERGNREALVRGVGVEHLLHSLGLSHPQGEFLPGL